MDRRQRAVQSHGHAQFLQGQVRLAPEQHAHLLVMGRQDPWLASGVVVAWSDLAGPPTLLEELFDHAQGDAVTVSNLCTGAFLMVVGGQDPFPQIQRQSSHAETMPQTSPSGYSFI